jgi:hypothetical protein
MTRARLPTLLAALALSGCAASGAAFQAVDSIPEGKALVYIYRPNSIVGGAIRYHVAVGDERIVYLIRGGYFPYLADPGETTFWARTEAKAEVTEYLKAGGVYYLKGGVGIGVAVGRPRLEFVDAGEGGEEVAECVLLPAATGRAE